MSQLQRLGNGETPTQLRRGLIVPTLPGSAGWFASFVVIALTGTWWARRYCLRRALIDHPGDRRSHSVPTPRGGGVAIVIAVLLAHAWLAWANAANHLLLAASAIGLILVAGVGWLDDHQPRSATMRLAVHCMAGLVVAGATWQMTADPMATGIALVAVPVLVNIWNFMDGLDGLAASQAALAAAAYALNDAQPALVALAWALSAACLGFLPFNFPRARIFLGDVGSGALGYMLAVLLVWISSLQNVVATSFVALLLPLVAFLVDASLTLLTRMMRGERWWTAHVDHLYQRLGARLGKHWPVTLAYAVWSGCGCLILWSWRARGVAINIWTATAWLAISVMVWAAAQAFLDRSAPQGRCR